MQGETQTQTQTSDTSLFFNMFEQTNYQPPFIRSVSQELDKFMQGGLHKGTITQLYGESGSGKTQIAMLFALGVSLHLNRHFPDKFQFVTSLHLRI